jgi:transposase
MDNYNTELTVGMDLGNKKHEICILDSSTGNIEKTDNVQNDILFVERYFNKFSDPSKIKIAIEAGTHSPWIYHLLKDMGFTVLVGNPRKLRVIWKTDYKSDKRDAEMLARIARLDTKLLHPIKHRNMEAHKDLNIIKCRDGLVGCRTNLVNTVRGLLKSQGICVPSSSTEAFAKKVVSLLPKELHLIFSDLISTIEELTVKIKRFDKQINKICEEKYQEAKHLQQIKGVGPITSLAFILTLEEHGRFKKSRDVGSFLGLVPKKDQSGETDKQLSITKSGNCYMRRILVSASQYILGPFGEDCDLKRYGLRISERGGKAAKRKAVVAVARKLAVLMHSLWKSGEAYEPLKNSKKKKNKKNGNLVKAA